MQFGNRSDFGNSGGGSCLIYEEAPTVTYVPQGRISQSPIDTKCGIVDTDGEVDPEINLKE